MIQTVSLTQLLLPGGKTGLWANEPLRTSTPYSFYGHCDSYHSSYNGGAVDLIALFARDFVLFLFGFVRREPVYTLGGAGVNLRNSEPYFLRQDLSWDLRPAYWARLTGQ